MSRKRFDKDLYEQYDALAKSAGIEYLKNQKYTVAIEPNPDRYGADLLYTCRRTAKGPVEHRSLECEVKTVWKGGGPFPYPTVQVPERKAKYFSMGTDYFLLADNAQDFCIITGTHILDSALREVPNRYMATGEHFFQVDVSKVTFQQLPYPAKGTMNFCCAELKLLRTGKNGVWVCENCGDTSEGNV